MKNKEFSLQMALMDALPVIFFSIATIALSVKLRSWVFTCGAIICVLAGAGKVAWKLLIALAKKDIPILGAQLRYLMPTGFLLMIAGAIMADRVVVRTIVKSAFQMPALLFFIVTVIGITGMILCARKFDRCDIRGNWIEQTINAIAQASFMAGIILVLK